MTSLLTNTAAMSSLQSLTATQRLLSMTQAQVSSGLAVANASDNEAYWSIGQIMSAQAVGLSAANKGLSLMSSMVAVTNVAVSQIITMMDGIRNDLISAQQAGIDLKTIQQDIAAKQNLIVNIANSASFNGQNWLVQNKTANITVPEMHSVQDTQANVMAQQAVNVQPAGPVPSFSANGVSPDILYSSGATPAGHVFSDDVTYVATAYETDASGIVKTETTNFQGTDVDRAFIIEGWKSDDGDSAPVPHSGQGAQWVPGSAAVEYRQSTQAVSNSDYTDLGSVSYSGAQDAIVPSVSSQSAGPPIFSIDTTQFTLFTHYMGTVNVAETSTYSDGQAVQGSIIFGDRSHSSTTPYTSYDVDNGFEEDAGALDTNVGGLDASSNRRQTPEDDLALASKTTVLNFDITIGPGSDLVGMQTAVEDDLASLRSMSAALGGATNTISTIQAFNSALSDALTSGIGSLVDADMNVASTRLQALQTQQQLGIQALSMANENSQLILKLFEAA